MAVAAGALLIRLPRLDLRPMHCDEANQAVKTGILLNTGVYHYDPHEHHGPTLYYFTLPVAWLSGAKRFADTTEFTYRIVPVVFGVGLILLLWPLGAGLGRPAAAMAALLIAISPAMVYYSRYYIQEMLLTFFTAATIVCGWRYWRKPSWGWALATGACVGLMHATKETCVIAFGAMAGSLVVMYFWSRKQRPAGEPGGRIVVRRVHVAVAVVTAVTVSVVFFSSFFTYARGPLDSVMTYVTTYIERGVSEQGALNPAHIHDHPWYYYLSLLIYFHNGLGPWFSEAEVVLLALVGIIVALGWPNTVPGDPGLLRFLSLYTVLMTVGYSIIPYKTPWCLLSFYHGMILMAGVGVVALWRWSRRVVWRGVLSLALAASVAHLGVETYRTNFVYPANPLNPYVYAHTSMNFLDLVQRIRDVAKISPDGRHTLIKVIVPNNDYWPLPFYLRKFDRVGYWSKAPADCDAPIIVTSPKVASLVESRCKDQYKSSFFGLRPNVLLLVYIRSDLWAAFIKTRE